ncbi:MAG TPA: hypothetical protein VGQ44_01635 [Gemmatimonadaceae bacterium]|nr:hypothetical protein [Gemmatimonadaceae bacterium]
MIRLEHRLSNTQRISEQCFRRGVIAEFAFHNGEAGERGGDIGILLARAACDREQALEDVLCARVLRAMNVQPAQLAEQRRECGVFPAEESFADDERFGEERLRFGFPCPAELPRQLSELEEGDGELPPKAGIAAGRDYRRVKAFGGGGLVPFGQRNARRIEPLGKQRFSVSHVHTVSEVPRPDDRALRR